jgi:hypothetical protein
MGTEDTLNPLEGGEIEEKDTPRAARKPRKVSEKPPITLPLSPTVRKHRVENVNRNQLAQVLDNYAAEGRVVVALNISRDIGGTYEVVSYKNEPVN